MPLPRRLYLHRERSGLSVAEYFKRVRWKRRPAVDRLQRSAAGAYIGFASFHAHHARGHSGQGVAWDFAESVCRARLRRTAERIREKPMKTFAVVLGLGLVCAAGAAQGVNCNMQGYKAVDGLQADGDRRSGDADVAGRSGAGAAGAVWTARRPAGGGGAGGAQDAAGAVGGCWARI